MLSGITLCWKGGPSGGWIAIAGSLGARRSHWHLGAQFLPMVSYAMGNCQSRTCFGNNWYSAPLRFLIINYGRFNIFPRWLLVRPTELTSYDMLWTWRRSKFSSWTSGTDVRACRRSLKSFWRWTLLRKILTFAVISCLIWNALSPSLIVKSPKFPSKIRLYWRWDSNIW